MKRNIIFLLFSFLLCTIVPSLPESNQAKAQIVTTLVPIAANDTLTDADTAWVYISTAGGSTTTGVADNISRSIQIVLTRLSGTAAGSFTLEGTIDGTNYITIATDTFTNAVTNTKSYSLRNSVGDLQYKIFRGVFITSGTVSAIPKVYYLRRSN